MVFQYPPGSGRLADRPHPGARKRGWPTDEDLDVVFLGPRGAVEKLCTQHAA